MGLENNEEILKIFIENNLDFFAEQLCKKYFSLEKVLKLNKIGCEKTKLITGQIIKEIAIKINKPIIGY